MTLYDGDSITAPVLGKYCGEDYNDAISSSSSNKVLINFQSDGGGENHGFKLKYLSYSESFIIISKYNTMVLLSQILK